MVDISDDMTATQDWLPLEEADALATEPGFYQLDSEYLIVAGIHMTRPGRRPSAGNRPNGRACARGAEGSTAATHSSGATLTRYYPDAPGGGDGIPQGGPLTEDLDADGNSITNAANLPTIVPGSLNGWDAETAFAEGFRIQASHQIWVAASAFTSGLVEPSWPDDNFALTVDSVADGDGAWSFVGFANQLDQQYFIDALLWFVAGGLGQVLPTSDPAVAGALWNDSGTVKVSAGA